jgi:hypothetical protein
MDDRKIANYSTSIGKCMKMWQRTDKIEEHILNQSNFELVAEAGPDAAGVGRRGLRLRALRCNQLLV